MIAVCCIKTDNKAETVKNQKNNKNTALLHTQILCILSGSFIIIWVKTMCVGYNSKTQTCLNLKNWPKVQQGFFYVTANLCAFIQCV